MGYVHAALQAITTSFPARRTMSQRAAFREWLLNELAQLGCEAEVVSGGRWPRAHNVVTRNQSPEVILLAHYDTGSRLPLGYATLVRLLGHGLWVAAASGILVALLADALRGVLASTVLASGLPRHPGLLFNLLALLLLCLPILITNRHNHNDNTSGVLVLLCLARALHEHPEIKRKVQLAFVDLEERGLHGSRHLRRRWRRQGIDLARTTIINCDCVGWGSVPFVSYAGPRERSEAIYRHLKAGRADVVITKGSLSDHFSFRREGASGIIFADPARFGRGYYVPNIHSPHDCQINLDNISWLVQELVEFCQNGAQD